MVYRFDSIPNVHGVDQQRDAPGAAGRGAEVLRRPRHSAGARRRFTKRRPTGDGRGQPPRERREVIAPPGSCCGKEMISRKFSRQRLAVKPGDWSSAGSSEMSFKIVGCLSMPWVGTERFNCSSRFSKSDVDVTILTRPSILRVEGSVRYSHQVRGQIYLTAKPPYFWFARDRYPETTMNNSFTVYKPVWPNQQPVHASLHARTSISTICRATKPDTQIGTSTPPDIVPGRDGAEGTRVIVKSDGIVNASRFHNLIEVTRQAI